LTSPSIVVRPAHTIIDDGLGIRTVDSLVKKSLNKAALDVASEVIDNIPTEVWNQMSAKYETPLNNDPLSHVDDNNQDIGAGDE